MTPEQFCYWLQGHAELSDHQLTPTPEQWLSIKEHLKTVFQKRTPTLSDLQKALRLNDLATPPNSGEIVNVTNKPTINC